MGICLHGKRGRAIVGVAGYHEIGIGEHEQFERQPDHPHCAERFADSDAARAEIQAKVPSALAANWKMIEDRLADGRPWVCGNQYTVADCYLYVFSRWLERPGAGGSDAMPHSRAHRTRMQERPAVQRVLAEEGLLPL